MSGHGKVLSAGIIVVRRVDAVEHRYLVLRAYRYWDFPKGMVEPSEAPIAAARREVMEETGIVDLAFTWGEAYRETPPYGRGKVARYYLAETHTQRVELPVSPELGRPEHHEYRWASFDEARGLLADRVKPILDWAEALVCGADPGI